MSLWSRFIDTLKTQPHDPAPSIPAPAPALPSSPLPIRTFIPVSPDPTFHAFEDLSLTQLFTHTFTDHFEVWNHLGEKDVEPETWRREHAADHGVVFRVPRAKRKKVKV